MRLILAGLFLASPPGHAVELRDLKAGAALIDSLGPDPAVEPPAPVAKTAAPPGASRRVAGAGTGVIGPGCDGDQALLQAQAIALANARIQCGADAKRVSGWRTLGRSACESVYGGQVTREADFECRAPGKQVLGRGATSASGPIQSVPWREKLAEAASWEDAAVQCPSGAFRVGPFVYRTESASSGLTLYVQARFECAVPESRPGS